MGSIEISVQMVLKGVADFGTLGYFAGNLAQDGIPVFTGITPPVSLEELKMLSAACATAGSVNMFHIVGLTPEAPSLEAVSKNKKKDLESKPPPPGKGVINSKGPPSLHFDIQIHISPDASPEQIDKVFESMARHLKDFFVSS